MAAVTVNSQRIGEVVPEQYKAGMVQCMTATYTNSGAKDANSIIQMFPVKANYKILDIHIQTTALGSGVTVDVGDGTTVDRFINGVDFSGAANARMMDTLVASSLAYKYTADDTIDFKILGAAFPDEAVITAVLYFVIETNVID